MVLMGMGCEHAVYAIVSEAADVRYDVTALFRYSGVDEHA